MLTSNIFYFLFSLSLSAPYDSNLTAEEAEALYDRSYQIVTGFMTNKYQTSSTFNPGERYIVEFDVTEIQKGPRRQKILTYSDDADSLKSGMEYLVFINKGKNGSSGDIIAIYKVCHHCDNAEIKEIYKIVERKWFRRIKPPLPAYTMGEGCGC